MLSDSVKVSDYARKAMRLHPDMKNDEWLLGPAAAESDRGVGDPGRSAASGSGEGETEDYRQNPEQEGSVIKGSMQWNK